jgi:hypothetical protein
MLRSVLGVVIGYAIFAAAAVLLFRVANRDPRVAASVVWMIGSIAYGIMFAFLGGYVAARIAARRPIFHAGVVALILLIGAILSFVVRTGGGAIWIELAAVFLMTPAAFLGGVLALRDSPGSWSE